MEQYKIDELDESYSLAKGDRLVMKNTLLEGFEIVYAGKPSKNKFSFIYSEREFLFSRTQGNLFFSTEEKLLKLNDKILEVIAVEDNAISLKYIK